MRQTTDDLREAGFLRSVIQEDGELRKEAENAVSVVLAAVELRILLGSKYSTDLQL